MANQEIESLRRRAVELGEGSTSSSLTELFNLYQSSYPAVRRAAASAIGKVLDRNPSASPLAVVPLWSQLKNEEAPQVLQYALKAMLKCAGHLNQVIVDDLMDIARNPTQKDYVRKAANEVIAAEEERKLKREAVKKHWCNRCKKTITEEEARRGIAKYGNPYCRHCFDEKLLEDAHFSANVEAAKQLRTIDQVAVQSQGEKRIGNWLASKGIAYDYDERIMIVRDARIRPDFYLPEFDLYIEYWGMNTPEYLQNMMRKKVMYQQARKKLISISYKDLANIEQILEEKLSKYIKL